MVKSFPMMAFHHETQRLAVGTPSGPIAIYDVRTSAKWKILEGHSHSVRCVEFDSKGNLLASYSTNQKQDDIRPDDLKISLRIWKVGNAGFFSTIMGGSGKSSKEFKLKPLGAESTDFSEKQPINPSGGTQNQKRSIKMMTSGKAMQPLDGQNKNSSSAKCKVRFVNNGKAVELTREDGSVEFHKLT